MGENPRITAFGRRSRPANTPETAKVFCRFGG
jgi:hypothetical protein